MAFDPSTRLVRTRPGPLNAHFRATFGVLTLVLLSTMLLSAGKPASAQTTPDTDASALPNHADFTVSRPSTVVQVRPGNSAQSAIDITNNLDSPAGYTLRHQALIIEDEGRVSLTAESNPIEDAASFAATVSVAAHATLTVPITMVAPRKSVPDTYLIGIIVTPTPTSPSSAGPTNSLQILTYLPLDVGDGRSNHGVDIDIRMHHRFVLGTSVSGSYSFYNTGTASTTASVDAAVHSSLTGGVRRIIGKPKVDGTFFLPSHHRKTFTFVTAVTSFWPSYSHARVTQSGTDVDAGTTGAAVGPSVLVVPKPFLALLVALAVACLPAGIHRRSRKNKGRVNNSKGDAFAVDSE